MTSYESNDSLQNELKKNRELLEKNNILLRKLHRNAKWAMMIQVLWYIVIIGIPFAFYFFILEPYFTALGSSYETFNAGMQEIPGWKQFYEFLESYQNSGTTG